MATSAQPQCFSDEGPAISGCPFSGSAAALEMRAAGITVSAQVEMPLPAFVGKPGDGHKQRGRAGPAGIQVATQVATDAGHQPHVDVRQQPFHHPLQLHPYRVRDSAAVVVAVKVQTDFD